MTVRCPRVALLLAAQLLPPMASPCASLFPATFSSVFRPNFFSPTSNFRRTPILIPPRRLAESIYADQALSSSIPATTSPTSTDWSPENNRLKQKNDAAESAMLNSVPRDEKRPYMVIEESEFEERSLKDYFERSADFIRSDGGPPRWFSPLECAAHSSDSPLLLFLPGIDGVGLGLTKHHQRLGKIYDVWCLHIPVRDRTPFTDLIKLVEKTIRLENQNAPNRPIYLVGESLGACLALSVAARNPDMDLVLILTNPATCFSKSRMEYLIPLLEVMPDAYHLTLPYILNLMKGDLSRTVMTSLEEGHLLQHAVGRLSQDIVGMSSYLSVLAEILPRETLIWKMQMLKSASTFANARLHAVKAQTLIICSGNDQLLPSVEEGERLSRFLPKCEIRRLNNSGHFLFLEDGVELLSIIKAARFYRRSKNLDYVSDYIPPTPSEFRKIYEPYRWLNLATSPVMISTLGNGNIVRGAAGIPSEGPVLLVGYHMLLGLELVPLVGQLFSDRNILVRGIAHPMMFTKSKEGMLPELSSFDTFRMMGAVPVSATNFYKLFSSKSHVLLYPGGMREALHRKGEKYKLFWPEQSEFVRMAARFGAKIVPFGAVGEDDIGEVVFDYDDQMKIPYLKNFIERLTDEAAKVRVGVDGEVGNQAVHCPWILPKLPGRFYYYFGRPIETEGRKQELRDREKAHELYLEVKREVERCLEYLKEKRECDPYRNLWPRLLYHSRHGINSEVPTFQI